MRFKTKRKMFAVCSENLTVREELIGGEKKVVFIRSVICSGSKRTAVSNHVSCHEANK